MNLICFSELSGYSSTASSHSRSRRGFPSFPPPKAGLVPGPGNLDRPPWAPGGRVGRPTRELRGPNISPQRRGGVRVFTPRLEPLGPGSGWWGSAPPHFPPRPLQGRLRTNRTRNPIGARRGPPRAHSPPGPSRLDPGGFRPVAALGGTVRAVFSGPCSFFLKRRGFPVPSFPSPSKRPRSPSPPPGDPCTPRHSPRDAHPPLSPGGRPCPGMRRRRGARQKLPEITGNCQVPGEPLAPTQGPRPPGPPAGGRGSKEPSNQREPPHLPRFPLRIGEVGG
jgi:hypothetical protein